MRALERLERSVSRAYVKAIREKKLAIGELEEAIKTGDVQRIDELTDFDDGDLQELTEEIRSAAIEGGSLEITGRFEKGLNPNSPIFTAWLQEKSSTLVTQLRKEQREAVREVLATNAQLGLNPRSTALDIAGRVTKSGAREGGIVGLNAPQANAVANARSNLMSVDPELMHGYLKNTRRDRRYDHIVKAAIAEGKPVGQKDLQKIVTRYQARLLQTRGETISRTETIEALNHGRQTKMEDVARNINGEVWKTWEATSGARPAHARADGQEVPVTSTFEVGGEALRYPGDSRGSAYNTVNCRCSMTFSVKRKEAAA